jgi:probable phosphoglycerate mutase
VKHEIWLVRHGETAWSLSGQHTGWTDLALNPEGEAQARRLPELLRGKQFAAVFSSPLQRARKTCEIAGYSAGVQYLDDLREFNYGEYEGRTVAAIRETVPDWSVWTHEVPGGETIDGVYARAGSVIEKALAADGDVLLFSHGHLLRLLAAKYLGMVPQAARHLALSTASVSVLGWERETRVIRRWNVTAEGR